MENTILIQARKLFLSYGYHSVTMDDIAREMGVSKKTLYENYCSKTKLIEDVIKDVCQSIKDKLYNDLAGKSHNAIEQIFESAHLIGELFSEKTRKPDWELKKYYPKLYEQARQIWEPIVKKYVYQNIQKGIAEGLYRQEIDILFFFRFFLAVKESEIEEENYPENEFSMEQIEFNHLEYLMRILVTPKGLKVLEEFLKK